MKTAARYKAVWELMTAVFADRQPADNIINAYFREGVLSVPATVGLSPKKSGILSAAGAA